MTYAVGPGERDMSVTELRAEIARLTPYVEAFRREEARADKYGGELDEKDAEIARLRAALKPFAKAAESAEDDEADSYSVAGSSARHRMTLGHLRKAKAALKEPTP